jgi:quercetin dioxygenase-like cupin family protein
MNESEVAPSVGYPAPFTRAANVLESRRVSPDGFSTWLIRATLADGATLEWDAVHGDEGIYVLDGSLDIDGETCGADGAVVIEAGVSCAARARGTTRIVHVGSYDPTPPVDGLYGAPEPGKVVHVVGRRGWFASGDRERVDARWFADSTCPTCRISFFHVRLAEGNRKDLPHTHTQDEIIHVLSGSIVFARQEYGPGTSLVIPANMRYSVTTGPDGIGFLNYRRDVSVQGYGTAKDPELEGGVARGGTEVRDLVDIAAR